MTPPLKILFFARIREKVGLAELSWPITDAITVTALLDALMAQYPALAQEADRLQVSVDHQLSTTHDVLIQPGSEVALFPPVTGG